MSSEIVSLYQLVRDWFRSGLIEGKYDGWIFDDDGMIWKPFHRYWFCVNDGNIEARDKGSNNPNYAFAEDVVRINAADPYFFEKLGALLILRA